MRKAGIVVATLVALSLPASANADKFQLNGQVAGAPAAKVRVGVIKEHGEVKRVTAIRVRRVPVTCEDGTAGALNANINGFKVKGRSFTKRGPLDGVGIRKGFVRVAGKFRRRGKVAKGTVRFAFQKTGGIGCGSGEKRWKAVK